jgi:hypothetical protein
MPVSNEFVVVLASLFSRFGADLNSLMMQKLIN